MIPKDARYTKDHEWVRIEGDTAVVGITDHAQAALGDITFVEIPAVGKVVKAHDVLAVVESVKAASDVYAPVAGTVCEVNGVLTTVPETINQSPHDQGWICKLRPFDAASADALLSAAQYEAFLAES